MNLEQDIKDFFDKFRKGNAILDEEFDALLPLHLRSHSAQHFTSFFIAEKAAKHLAKSPGLKILDIGSGVGKFCLASALRFPTLFFTGVEFRKEFCEIGLKLAKTGEIMNVEFRNENILNVDFSEFDGFFMFNPFLELRNEVSRIDDKIKFHENDNSLYVDFIFKQLSNLNSGKRLVTYYVPNEQIPPNLIKTAAFYGETLVFWEVM